jgi:hypothetical protein
MRIEPHFDFWNHFFHIRLLPVSDVEAVVLGGMDIYVKSWHGVDSYFHLPMPSSSDGWWKYGSSLGTMLTRRSPCSRIATPSPNPTRGTGGQEGPP